MRRCTGIARGLATGFIQSHCRAECRCCQQQDQRVQERFGESRHPAPSSRMCGSHPTDAATAPRSGQWSVADTSAVNWRRWSSYATRQVSAVRPSQPQPSGPARASSESVSTFFEGNVPQHRSAHTNCRGSATPGWDVALSVGGADRPTKSSHGETSWRHVASRRWTSSRVRPRTLL